MKILIQFLGTLLLTSITNGIIWEENIARMLLPKAMGSFAWIRLLMDQPEKLSATELITKYNYPAELHEIQTEDGYFLTVHRIPSGRNNSHINNKPAVLLFHSLSTSSDAWILQGPKDIAFILADNGYDVWITNCRGNFYSRKHVTLNPDTDKNFWDYSFHEMGKYDLPATIDYILYKTGHEAIFYIGHSMGNTVFFTFTTLKPEYNKKIKLMLAFAPPVLFAGQPSDSLKFLRDSLPTITNLLEISNYYEVLPLRKRDAANNEANCKIPARQIFCKAFIYAVVGYNEQQNSVGSFRQFDYGVNVNKKIYNNEIPMEYNSSQVTAPVHLYYGDGDSLVSGETARALEKHLPKCTGTTRVPYHYFNHLDFLYNPDCMTSLLYDQVISRMNKYK